MSLSHEDISTVRRSWAVATQCDLKLSELFYNRLFQIAPEVRDMFADDIIEQRRKLMLTLNFVVENLDRPELLLPEARALAARHVGYGVTADQYAPVGAALIWALQSLVGDRFGAEEERVWSEAYQTLSDVMIAHAYGGAEPAA